MSSLRIEPRLPRFDGRGGHRAEFEELAGAAVLRIGYSPDLDLEGGGLVIERAKTGGEHGWRLLRLGFNEIGMWVED